MRAAGWSCRCCMSKAVAPTCCYNRNLKLVCLLMAWPDVVAELAWKRRLCASYGDQLLRAPPNASRLSGRTRCLPAAMFLELTLWLLSNSKNALRNELAYLRCFCYSGNPNSFSSSRCVYCFQLHIATLRSFTLWNYCFVLLTLIWWSEQLSALIWHISTSTKWCMQNADQNEVWQSLLPYFPVSSELYCVIESESSTSEIQDGLSKERTIQNLFKPHLQIIVKLHSFVPLGAAILDLCQFSSANYGHRSLLFKFCEPRSFST